MMVRMMFARTVGTPNSTPDATTCSSHQAAGRFAGPLQLLDSGLFPDHLPFRDLAGNVRFELIGSRTAHQRTEIEDLFGYARASEQLLHRFVRLLNHHGRRAGRKGEPVPTRDVVTGHARFGEGRDIGEHGVALRRGDGDGLEFAHLNLTFRTSSNTNSTSPARKPVTAAGVLR